MNARRSMTMKRPHTAPRPHSICSRSFCYSSLFLCLLLFIFLSGQSQIGSDNLLVVVTQHFEGQLFQPIAAIVIGRSSHHGVETSEFKVLLDGAREMVNSRAISRPTQAHVEACVASDCVHVLFRPQSRRLDLLPIPWSSKLTGYPN